VNITVGLDALKFVIGFESICNRMLSRVFGPKGKLQNNGEN
jgi:hypothetical protein